MHFGSGIIVPRRLGRKKPSQKYPDMFTKSIGSGSKRRLRTAIKEN